MTVNQDQKIANSTKAAVFAGLGGILIVIGLILTPNPAAISAGFYKLITATALLDTNTFLTVEGALGVPFINSGLLVLLVVSSYLLVKCDIAGGQIAAMFMVLGFGFCGKTILNVWPLLAGVLLHAKVNNKPLASVMNLAWFSTALSPVFNMIAFYSLFDGTNTGAKQASFGILPFILAIIAGVIAGYGVAFFAGILPAKHNGYTLYNAGFAAGICGFLIFGLMKAIGIGHAAPAHEYPNVSNFLLAGIIAVLLLYLGICGAILGIGKETNLKQLMCRCEKGGDHVNIYGFASSLINMCVIGFICLGYCFLVSSNFHGPLFAALFTVVGFASNGITVKTALPLLAGVFVTSIFTGGICGALRGENFWLAGYAYSGGKNMLIAALYACGMSPVTGALGPVEGFLSGAVHSLIVPNVGVLHGWMNLYNNGFSLGIVTTFYVPIMEKLAAKKKKRQEIGTAASTA